MFMVVVLLYVPVLFIVLLHAVPVFFIAAWTESKVALVLAAVVSGCIGVATGNPSYVVADLIGVAVGVALGFSLINNQMPSAAPQKETPLPAPPPAPRAPEKQEEDWFWIFIGAMLVFCAVLFFLKRHRKTSNATSTAACTSPTGSLCSARAAYASADGNTKAKEQL